MDYPTLSELNSASSILKRAWDYFYSNFTSFTKFSVIVYLPLLILTSFQIIIYLLKVENIFSSIILDFFSTILSLATVIISLAVEPTIYAVLIIVFIQIIKKEKIDFQSIKTIFSKKSNNFIKSVVVFFLFFITVQQISQLILLVPLSFSTLRQSIDIETFFFSESVTEKINSIDLQQIVANLYPNIYFLTEFISMVVAAIFTKKYYFYIPITIVENVTQLIPLNNSKLLVKEVNNIATKLFFLGLFIPYLVNLINTLIFTKILGLQGTLGEIFLNISAIRQISLFISALINIFIYPTLTIAALLLYLKARQSLGETNEDIFSKYKEDL